MTAHAYSTAQSVRLGVARSLCSSFLTPAPLLFAHHDAGAAEPRTPRGQGRTRAGRTSAVTAQQGSGGEVAGTWLAPAARGEPFDFWRGTRDEVVRASLQC